MMDDKLNLCPGTEGEWWQRYLSWEWRLGSGEAGCLKAQDIDKFILWTPLLGPFLCFESWPLAKWPTSLMLPVCEKCCATPGILPLLKLVVHSSVRPKSLTHFEPRLFGLFRKCEILGHWVNLCSQSYKWILKYSQWQSFLTGFTGCFDLIWYSLSLNR